MTMTTTRPPSIGEFGRDGLTLDPRYGELRRAGGRSSACGSRTGARAGW
ncbi:hypothetical protein ACFQHO_03540 [Actinomadura yumaensis]